MEATRIFDFLTHSAERRPNVVALAGKKKGQWEKYTYQEFKAATDNVAKALIQLGVEKEDKIVIISNNRPEWNILDMAIGQAGGITVSLYPSFSQDDFEFICKQVQPKYIFVANRILYKIMKLITKDLACVQEIFTMDQIRDARSVVDLVEVGAASGLDDQLAERMEAVTGEDVASIYYTSGTGGDPKGVVHRHKHSTLCVPLLAETIQITQDDVAISYLPLCHAYERNHVYVYQYVGIPVYYAESTASFVSNLQEVMPTLFTSVPFLLEKVYAGIIQKGSELEGPAYEAFLSAMTRAQEFDIEDFVEIGKNQRLDPAVAQVHQAWSSIMGSRLRMVLTAGAPLPEHIARFFYSMGIKLLDCYGITEAFLVTYNEFPNNVKFGTVGPPSKGVELKIAEDGEILVRSPFVMKEYYKIPELTKKVLDDEGWFHTADIGEWVEGKYVKLTGRKRSVIKLSSGRFVSLDNVEKQINRSDYINNIAAFIDNGKLNVILIPSIEALGGFLKEKGLENATPDELMKQEDLIEVIKQEVKKHYNRYVTEPEKVKNIFISTQEWTIQGGELTPNMKVKRHAIVDKYKPQLEAITIEN